MLMLMLMVPAVSGCGGKDPVIVAMEESFQDAVPLITQRCQQILDEQQDKPISDIYVSGPILILISWSENARTLYDDPWQDTRYRPSTQPKIDWRAIDFMASSKDFKPLLATKDSELRTVVWVTQDVKYMWSYQNGVTAWRPDWKVWIIDLKEERLSGYQFFEGSPPREVYTLGGDQLGEEPRGELLDWLWLIMLGHQYGL